MARNSNMNSRFRKSSSPPLPRNFPKPPPSSTNLPTYIVLPALTLSGSILYAYYHFQDEVPYTKRKRLLATSSSFEKQLGDQEYKKLLKTFGKKNILPEHHRASVTVRRIGSRIADSADRFMLKYSTTDSYHNASSLPTNKRSSTPYTYTVVRSNQANAFVLPGNHVFVLTGLFRYAQNEDELAAVLGHEMAHNIARHAGERLSGNVLMSLLGKILLLIDPSMTLYMMFGPAMMVLRELPHSREHEVEADNAMKAGEENDQNSVTTTSTPPEFLSTHPSYDSRLSNFDNWMSDAMAIYNEDGGMKCQQIRREMSKARKLAAKEHAMREQGRQGGQQREREIQFGVLQQKGVDDRR